MKSADNLFLKTLEGTVTSRVPFWFMRQAGRYLPEYRAIREEMPDFLSLCYDPEKASEVTLQPIRRFHMDAAILFCDILVVPDALGVNVKFVKGEGPRLEKVTNQKQLQALKLDRIQNHLNPVTKTIKLTKKSLGSETALIGFAGAPWTVACYMLQGKGGNFNEALALATSQPELVDDMITLLVNVTIDYVSMQIKAGVDAIQLFDSWAGLVPDDQFDRLVVQPNAQIISEIKQRYPDIPVIGFAKSIGDRLQQYAQKTNANGLGVSMDMSLASAIQNKQPHQALQGNLDNQLLADDLDGALKQAENILHMARDIPFIFNLGHGMLPHTPVKHVEALCHLIRSYERESNRHYA